MATTKQIFQHLVPTLPSVGLSGHIYYVENGNGTDLDEYVADSSGLLRFIGSRPNLSSSSSVKIKIILGEVIGGGSLIYINNSKAYKYNQSDLNLYDKLTGITNQAGVLNEEIDIILSGECSQLGGLISGDQYFAANNGLITNVPPVLNIFQPIGVAKNTTTILLNIEKPYIKI